MIIWVYCDDDDDEYYYMPDTVIETLSVKFYDPVVSELKECILSVFALCLPKSPL